MVYRYCGRPRGHMCFCSAATANFGLGQLLTRSGKLSPRVLAYLGEGRIIGALLPLWNKYFVYVLLPLYDLGP